MTRVLTIGLLAGLCGVAMADVKLTGDNTKIEWTGTKPNGKHTGTFKTITGTVTGSTPETAVIDVTIDTASLESDNPALTGHLKNPDFFDVKTHKAATFKSTKVERAGGKYTVTGDFTLCGKTKSISFPADISMTPTGLTLTAEFGINRLDFGCGTKFPDSKIADKVLLVVKVDAK
jgi:polyisoprenoid-binding protein YceI